jgi:hypothetical protein
MKYVYDLLNETKNLAYPAACDPAYHALFWKITGYA